MRDYIELRAIEVGKYIIDSKATVRKTATKFGVSKSTVHKDLTERLPQIDHHLADEVRDILDINKSERKCQVFLQHFFKKIFNIVYLLFIIYNDIIRLQLQLFLSSFLKKCIEKRLSSGSHFLYAPLSFILLIFPFH